MDTDFAVLSHALRERESSLGPPVDAADWRRFSEALPVVPGADFRTISSAFEAMDQPSHIRLWSCDKIVAHRNAGGADVSDLPLVCIEDILIESIVITSTSRPTHAPVRWFGDDEIQAPSLRDFVAAIAAGRFDL